MVPTTPLSICRLGSNHGLQASFRRSHFHSTRRMSPWLALIRKRSARWKHLPHTLFAVVRQSKRFPSKALQNLHSLQEQVPLSRCHYLQAITLCLLTGADWAMLELLVICAGRQVQPAQLMAAFLYSPLELCQWLLLRTQWDTLNTPAPSYMLQLAIACQAPALVQLCLELGANPRTTRALHFLHRPHWAQSLAGEEVLYGPPLGWAPVVTGQHLPQLTRLLVEEATQDELNEALYTAIHTCQLLGAYPSRREAVGVLLDRGAQVTGMDFLKEAVYLHRHWPELLPRLLQRGGQAYLHDTDTGSLRHTDRSLIELALFCNNGQLVKFFLREGLQFTFSCWHLLACCKLAQDRQFILDILQSQPHLLHAVYLKRAVEMNCVLLVECLLSLSDISSLDCSSALAELGRYAGSTMLNLFLSHGVLPLPSLVSTWCQKDVMLVICLLQHTDTVLSEEHVIILVRRGWGMPKTLQALQLSRQNLERHFWRRLYSRTVLPHLAAQKQAIRLKDSELLSIYLTWKHRQQQPGNARHVYQQKTGHCPAAEQFGLWDLVRLVEGQ